MMTPQAPGNQNDDRIECLLTHLGNPFSRAQPPIREIVVRSQAGLTPSTMPEDLEPGLLTECTTNQKVISHLVFLITKGTRPDVGQTVHV
jgi:hypothetical protein